jgi:hypothetical protein
MITLSFNEIDDINGGEDPAVIKDRRDKADLLRWITLSLGFALLLASLINFFMFIRYQRKEEVA